jgi:hypothetical protein
MEVGEFHVRFRVSPSLGFNSRVFRVPYPFGDPHPPLTQEKGRSRSLVRCNYNEINIFETASRYHSVNKAVNLGRFSFIFGLFRSIFDAKEAQISVVRGGLSNMRTRF